MSLKNTLFLLTILALSLVSCTARPADSVLKVEAAAETPTSILPGPVELNVFAAASLSEPFGEIGKLFEADHPGVTVVFNFAGSQQLAQQINEGAPADVFASANNTQMNTVIEAGGILSGSRQTFTNNRLAVIFPQENPAGLRELKDLAKPGIKLLLAAKEVPVGEYTLDFLDNASADLAFGGSFKGEVLRNVVSYEDNVKAVLAKLALGEADAGIVYISDISGKDAVKVGRLDIPQAFNVIASYPIAPVKDSKNPDLAQVFIEFVLAHESQDILAKYNFFPMR